MKKLNNLMMVLNKCPECGDGFIKIGKKIYCSTKCAVKVSFRNFQKRKFVKEGRMEWTKVCPECKTQFKTIKLNKTYCDHKCANNSAVKRYVLRNKGYMRELIVSDGLRNEISNFIESIKNKSFYLDTIDVLRLIDLYDRVYRNDSIVISNKNIPDLFEGICRVIKKGDEV